MAPSVAFDMDSVESLETAFVGDFGMDLSRMQQRPQQVIRGVLRHASTRLPVHNPDITKHIPLPPEIIEEDIYLLEAEAANPVEDLVFRTAKEIGSTIGKDFALAAPEDSISNLQPSVVGSSNPNSGVDALLQYTKDTLSDAVTSATEVLLQSSTSSSSTSSSSSTTGFTTASNTVVTSSSVSTMTSSSSTTTARTTGPLSGVLHIPGHEPEAPADLNLVHHDRSFDEINGTELNGISVKDDSTYLTPEGATTLILVGMIIVFLVFICLIMFIQKLRRQRIEAKVQEDVTNEFTKTEMKEKELDNYKTMSAINDQLLRSLIQSVSRLELRQPHDLSTSSFMQTDPASTSGNLGQLWFSIYYDYTKGVLKLSILHASYPPGHSENPADVWVECCVLTPLNTVMADTKTTSRKATVAPVFNQAFTFKARADEVRQCLLRLTLYEQQPKKPEKAVGSIIVPLSSLDLDAGVTLSRILH